MTYMIASVWDGVANLVAGIMVDRRHATLRYGAILVAGAVPLGACFMLMYMPPLMTGGWAIATILVAHLLFRTAYAAVNVPYLAMTARVSADGGDRAFIAGMRMLFGTAAAVVVALCTIPVGRWLAGATASQSYFASAILFAVVGTLILMLVGATYREGTTIQRPLPDSVRAVLVSLFRNRAFVTLSAAMMAMIVAITVINKSVLYYFKYLLNDPEAGQLALASMGVVSGVAIPLWMMLGRIVGLRALWFIAAGLGIAALGIFAAADVHESALMQAFLIALQVMIVGLNFVFWAMLPNTVEYGEQATGLHIEGSVFGVASLLQRIAIGVATAILGWSFASAGYVANVQQSAGTLSGMRATIVVVPVLFLALSCVAMLSNPLGRQPRGKADLGAEPA
jgi:GPH family glycoside/pentoside/hexuronide:cation symporter